MYADDVTQIVTPQNKSKQMMKIKVERELERINRYEKELEIRNKRAKIQDNTSCTTEEKKKNVNGKNTETSKERTLLGLKLQFQGLLDIQQKEYGRVRLHYHNCEDSQI